MEREELKETLKGLHEQLRSGEQIDPELRALLLQLSTDVNNVAQSTAGTSPPSAEAVDRESLVDRLFGLTEEFEESHPQLAQAIGNVATALSRIGI